MTTTGIILSTLGGVTLLLWGCRMVRTGVVRAYGANLQQLIARWAKTRLRALLSGALVGTALQSSTATAILLAGFVGREAIGVAAALAVLLGADLGAAIAAAIFSSGVSAAWPLIGFAGYIIHVNFDGRSVLLKNVGRILIGFGLLLLGLQIIGGSAASLSESDLVKSAIATLAQEPVLAILMGAALTWIMHSSLAMVLLLVALATGGSLTLEALYAVLLGVNLGAALPAISATMSELPIVRRVPLGNLIFRLFGVCAVAPFLPLIAAEIGRHGLSPAMSIIAFHLAFNAALCVAFALLTGPVAKLTELVFPKQTDDEARLAAKYLDDKLFETPAAALGAAARETLRMGELVETMLTSTLEVLESNDKALQAEVRIAEDQVDYLNNEIKIYLTKLMRGELDGHEGQRAVDILTFTTNLEHVGDIIDKNLLDLADKKRRSHIHFSEQGMDEIRSIHARIMDTLQLSLNVFLTEEAESARQLIARKSELRTLGLEGTENHIDRLRLGLPESVATSSIHLDVLRDLKRINSHLTSVAYPVLERAGQLRDTRLKKLKAARTQLASS